MRVAGVDEAGKGPVLGSMFAAAVVVDPENLPDDVGDSKDIAPERREVLAERIRDVADAVAIAEIPVERIDADGTDMNSLTVAAHTEALDAAVADLDERGPIPADTEQRDRSRSDNGQRDRSRSDNGQRDRSRPDSGRPDCPATDLSCYLDAGDGDAVRFERRVAESLSLDADLAAEHGADATYPVVGAASIVAKVERDAHVAALAEEYGELGSGYPSDPTTRAFLRSYVEDHGDLPPCARACWRTSRDALAAASQSSLGEF